LGSAEDAKDAIQDVLSGHLTAERNDIENEKGYLIKSVINHAINLKKRKSKMRYGNVWLPEPFATEGSDTNINLRDIASYSMLMLLENLNPKERAVFILKEAFGYTHEEIAEVLSSSVESSRKLLSRAKTRLEGIRDSQPSLRKESMSRDFLEKYIDAIRERDLKRLEGMLSDDIVYHADGGGKMQIVKDTCVGNENVADLLVFLFHKFQTSQRIVMGTVNHQPALFYFDDSVLKACQVFSYVDGKIQQINTVLDPDKLKNILNNS
jgi:RNA polymerase sigma factor (sigma-70 family)